MANADTRSEPIIIQGGMGAAVSCWQLARAVSLTGQLGVVSGTALDAVIARRLQKGDAGGHIRRALKEFPYPRMAERYLQRFFIPGGKLKDKPFIPMMVITESPTQEQLEWVVVANFVEVYLAKEGHSNPVGINYLEKIQTPTLPSIFGAMLAGVDYVLMGAGIPRAIPGILDRLTEGLPVEMPLNVVGAKSDESFMLKFDPMEFTGGELPWLERPKFLAIVASVTLASMLARKASGRVDGFVIEGPTAGGHNAPPRGQSQMNERGEPIYGPRDEVDLEAIRALGLPFWLAGSYGAPEQLQNALDAGAAGVQVGTAFAYCEESGLDSSLRHRILQRVREGQAEVFTDPVASPTGFPFKVVQLDGTISEEQIYEERQRICDMGFLRHAYRKEDGTIGWRCPSEPVKAYVQKGGAIEDTVGRKCLCNGLMANVGLEQVRGKAIHELPLVTSGDEVKNLRQFFPNDGTTIYHAADVIEHLLAGVRTCA